MRETYDIAGYCRISVDEEMDRENISIENQKAIIAYFVEKSFPVAACIFTRIATARAIPLSSERATKRCAPS